MRTCSCGKANLPTRKYCIRCGASLLKTEEKEIPQEPISVEEYQSVNTPQKVTIASEETPPPEMPSISTEDRWVRPSEVSRDRVRTAEIQVGKTELEKAQEAFAKADDVDIDDRMLRASELKELMADGPASLVTAPVAEPIVATPVAEPIVATPVAEPIVATPVAEPTVATPAPESPVALTETSTDFSSEPPDPETSEVESEHSIPSPEVPHSVLDQHEDRRIREVDSDIVNYKLQAQQLNAELDERRIQYSADVKWLRTVVEQKRMHLKKIEVNLDGAKRALNEAQKEFREAEKLKKQQISEMEKRITSQSKRITNAEKARDKRLKEIEKEKQAGLS
ncbi:MAG: hypothetical protein ACTSV2_08215 [Candidatus Thorarchaeota archaeon]